MKKIVHYVVDINQCETDVTHRLYIGERRNTDIALPNEYIPNVFQAPADEKLFFFNIEISLTKDVLVFLMQWSSFIAWKFMNSNVKTKFRDVEKLEKKIATLKLYFNLTEYF